MFDIFGGAIRIFLDITNWTDAVSLLNTLEKNIDHQTDNTRLLIHLTGTWSNCRTAKSPQHLTKSSPLQNLD